MILVFSSLVLAIRFERQTAARECISFSDSLRCLRVIAIACVMRLSTLVLLIRLARRSAFLWAVLPFVSIAAMERIMFGSSHFGKFLGYRVVGGFSEAFRVPEKSHAHSGAPLSDITLANFLTTPGLWIGLAFAAAFLTAAIRLRRNREPI